MQHTERIEAVNAIAKRVALLDKMIRDCAEVIADIKANTAKAVICELKEDGKPKFSNELMRDTEITIRLIDNADYQRIMQEQSSSRYQRSILEADWAGLKSAEKFDLLEREHRVAVLRDRAAGAGGRTMGASA